MQQKPRLRGIATISDRPARVGKLKIGERTLSRTGKEIPTKLDYIKALDGAGNIVQAFHDVYGPKPTEFKAVFPSNNPDDFFWEAYRRYGSGTGLVCHGNGTKAIVEETGETIDCPCEFADGDRPTCKPVASLSLFLYEVPALGVFQVDTGSINSIRNIRWFLSALRGLTGGQYAGIPFRVRIEPFQAMHDGKASTAYQWKLDLLPGYKPADLRMAAQRAVDTFLLPPDLAEQPLLDEYVEPDIYGLPAGEPEIGVVDTETAEATGTQDIEPPDDMSSEILGQEILFRRLLEQAALPAAKADDIERKQAEKRALATGTGDWAGYARWLHSAISRLNQMLSDAQGALV
jgi:hypothetical protein